MATRNPKAKAPTTGLDISIQTLWIMVDFNYRSLKDGELIPRFSEGQAAAASFVFAPDFKGHDVMRTGWNSKNRGKTPQNGGFPKMEKPY